MAEESRSLGEYSGLGGRALARERGTPTTTSVVVLSAASAANTADLTLDSHFRLIADVDCWIKVGAAGVTATVNDMYLPAKTPFNLHTKLNMVRVAAIAGGAGKLYITELEGS